MKKLFSLFLILPTLGFLAAPSRAGEVTDVKLTKQISDILTECQKMAPGTQRAELMKTFTTEGGFFSPTHRILVHRRCPCIKVEVEFTLSDTKQEDERPTDTVSKISKPYLEWSHID